jgi:hypothetical protein
MNRYRRREQADIPGADAWLAFGLLSLAAGLWLLRVNGLMLVTLWGIGLTIIGTALTITSLGLFLRIWR